MLSLDIRSQISLIGKNRGFLEELIKHLVRRYGISEVESWHFELEQNAVSRRRKLRPRVILRRLMRWRIFSGHMRPA